MKTVAWDAKSTGIFLLGGSSPPAGIFSEGIAFMLSDNRFCHKCNELIDDPIDGCWCVPEFGFLKPENFPWSQEGLHFAATNWWRRTLQILEGQVYPYNKRCPYDIPRLHQERVVVATRYVDITTDRKTFYWTHTTNEDVKKRLDI